MIRREHNHSIRGVMALAERLSRIDDAIACHRTAYLAACWAGHDGECEVHETEVDRLLDLRIRVERGHGRMTVFIPERTDEATT